MNGTEVAELFQRIGAPPVPDVRYTTPVKVGIKSITFAVPGATREEMEENLRLSTQSDLNMGMIESIELDWSTVEGLPDADAPAWSPGETDDEILATRIRIETGIRTWLMEQLSKKARWCTDGVNGVLDELGIEPLPEESEYKVRREVTGTWEVLVDAYSMEDALERVAREGGTWELDSDGEKINGMVIIKTMSDDITAELNEDEENDGETVY